MAEQNGSPRVSTDTWVAVSWRECILVVACSRLALSCSPAIFSRTSSSRRSSRARLSARACEARSAVAASSSWTRCSADRAASSSWRAFSSSRSIYVADSKGLYLSKLSVQLSCYISPAIAQQSTMKRHHLVIHNSNFFPEV